MIYLLIFFIIALFGLFIYKLRQDELFRIFLKTFEYDDKLIQNCIKDYWGLTNALMECQDKSDLKILKREIYLFETSYYNLVPLDLLDLHLERLNEIYKEKFHTLA